MCDRLLNLIAVTPDYSILLPWDMKWFKLDVPHGILLIGLFIIPFILDDEMCLRSLSHFLIPFPQNRHNDLFGALIR